jgi:hypothetical protein
MGITFVPTAGATAIKSQAQLSKLFSKASATAKKQDTADAKQALAVYNKIVADGRYVKQFASNPSAAAKRLGLELTAAQADKIRAAIATASGGAAATDVELVAVAVIVLVLAVVPDREIVIDSAGRIKA